MSDSTEREKEIFNQALEMTAAEARSAFLLGACGHDKELRNRIEALLRAYDSADGFIPEKAQAETLQVTFVPPERPGTVIGRYKLLQQIGEGGMGVVYMAEQTEPVVRKVALKIIKLGMDTRNVIARFEAERQALALMDHPNIAKVLDAGATDSGRPYFVMELVRGVPITEYCDKNKLSPIERLELFIPVCQAIQHAHQKGIIHRDIKPSNVMVTLHDGKPVPRVIDFGIAKATNQRLTEKTLFTNYAQMIGTPAYMSPEQAEMSGLDVDTRTDVYSLGVLLYELLTGTTPFPSKELLSLGYGEMQRVIAESEPPKPSTRLSTMEKEERTVVAKNRSIEASALAKRFRGDLDWIVMKAIEKDRSHRYDTANGLAMDVQRHLQNEPVVARPANAAYRLHKLIRRNKLAFAAGTAVAAALLVGATFSTWQAVRATRARRLEIRVREQAQASEQLARQAQANEAKERQVAEESRASEAAQRRLAEAQAYASDVSSAQQALAANNLGRARELLDQQRPLAGQKDRRGWEWRWLWNQCRGDAIAQLPRGTTSVRALAPSPDGKWLAIADWSGSLAILDISNLSASREMARFPTGGGPASAAFAPGSGLLAYSSVTNFMGTNAQSRIHLWDPQSRQIQTELVATGSCVGLALSADGSKLLSWTVSERSQQLALWQLPEGQKLAAYDLAGNDGFDGEKFAASPDLSLAAIPSLTLQVIELATGKPRWSITNESRFFGCAAFSPDGKLLATAEGRADSSIRFWDTTTGKELGPGLKDHRVVVSGLVFFPDGKTLASSSFDQTIRLWDVSDPVQVRPRGRPLRGHASSVTTLALLPDHQTLVSGAWDGSVLAWNTARIRDRLDYVTLPGIRNWHFDADGKSILVLDQKGRVARRQGSKFETEQPLLDLHISRWGHFSEDGRFLAVGLTNGTVELFDLDQRSLLRQFGHYAEPVEADFVPDGKHLVVFVGNPPVAHLWDLASFQESQSWQGLDGPTSMSSDGRWYFECGSEGGVLLKDLTTGKEQRPRLDIEDAREGNFSPDGRLLAVASQRGYVRLWEMPSLRRVATLGSFLIGAHTVGFSPDGTRLMAGGDGSEAVKIWDVESRRELLTLEGQNATFWTPKLSPDGNVLGSLQQDGFLHLWRAPSWAEIAAAEQADEQLRPFARH